MRSIICSLLLTFSLSVSLAAQTFPEIPKSQRILSAQEVKNFWINRMPETREPSRLSRDYASLMVNYHQQVGARHRLIQAIEAGRHDRHATIFMLRHNIVAYRLMGNNEKVLELSEELAALEAIADNEAAESANADRLERLIAATERLAAAIEKNGGTVPDDAQQLVDEIVPFERDRNDRRSIISHLHDEIAICRQPIIVYQPSSNRHRQPTTTHRPKLPSQPQVRPARGNTPQVTQPSVRPARGNTPLVTQPRVRPATGNRPQVVQPRVRPAPSSRPQVVQPQRTQPAPRPQRPAQPRVRQPQVPSIRR